MHFCLVLLGPPAAGKGTQADLLRNRFGFQAPSVGEMLREQKTIGTPAGLKAAEYFERGLLVPDEITIEVVRQWVAGVSGAWALDGFPRTVKQAEAFDQILSDRNGSVNAAVLIEVEEPVIRDRVSHRLVCTACGISFRKHPKVASETDPCLRCGGTLGRRKDDNMEALTDRLSEYRAKSEPVSSYYQERGILSRIDGARPIEDVFADLVAVLEAAPAEGGWDKR